MAEELVNSTKEETLRETDYALAKTVVVLFLLNLLDQFLTILTSYYPLSELFRDRLFHARWIGINVMVDHVLSCCLKNHNYFIDRRFYRDENFYYLFGRLEKETTENIFGEYEAYGRESGVNIMYRGKMDDGYYKFMALVDQNWRQPKIWLNPFLYALRDKPVSDVQQDSVCSSVVK